jgi:putative transposase
VTWYNHEHLHSSIGFVTPLDRHDGNADAILAKRKAVYEQARQRHPERWSGKTRAWDAPMEVVLNPAKDRPMAQLKAAGRVRRVGQRNLTRYYPAVVRAADSQA